MGSYVTTSSLSLILPGYLQGDTTTSDTAGTAIASYHIDRAEARVNGALALRYTVPFASTAVPPLVRTITEDIMAYNLLTSGGFRQGSVNEYVKTKYDDSIDMLKKMVSGEMSLIMTDGSIVSPNTTKRYKCSTEDYEMIFNMDDAENYEISKNESNDISDTRD